MEKAIDAEAEKNLALLECTKIKPDYRGPVFWISRNFMKELRKKSPKNLDPCVNTDILCKHDGLSAELKLRQRVTAPLWEYIKKYFPAAREFPCTESRARAKTSSSAKAIDLSKDEDSEGEEDYDGDDRDTCFECGRLDRVAQRAEDERIQKKKDHKKQLPQLARLLPSRETSRPSMSHCRHPTDAGTYYLLDLKWLKDWKDWVEDQDLVLKDPEPLTCQALRCRHDMLIINAVELIENASNRSFAIVTEKEWALLLELYGVAAGETEDTVGIPLFISEEGEEPIVLEPCPQCIQEAATTAAVKAAHFSNQTFTVRQVDRRGPGRGARAAKRSRTKTDRVNGVDCLDTVMQLKLKIFASTEVAPAEQMLYFNSKEIDDNDESRDNFELKTLLDAPGKTLSDFQVKAGDIITLVHVDPQEGGEEEEIAALISSAHRREDNVGFANTALGGTPLPKKKETAAVEHKTTDESAESSSRQADDVRVVEAPIGSLDSEGWEKYDAAAFGEENIAAEPATAAPTDDPMEVDADNTVDMSGEFDTLVGTKKAPDTAAVDVSGKEKPHERSAKERDTSNGDSPLPSSTSKKRERPAAEASDEINASTQSTGSHKSRKRKLNNGTSD